MLHCQFSKKNVDDVIFLIGDNVSTNVKIARLLGVPLIGCASHRLNLATQKFLSEHDDLLGKINDLMKKLSTLKKAADLRTKTPLRPVLRNVTRWSSTFAMIGRYFELETFISKEDPDLVNFLPSASDHLRLRKLFEELKKFESISKKLQEETTNIAEMRILFDSILVDYSYLDHYLGYGDGTLTHASDFEVGIANYLQGKATSKEQDEAISVLSTTAATPLVDNLTPAEKILAEAKKQKVLCPSWIACTSNIVERLFSRARYVFTDYRKRTTPVNLESQLFLFSNKSFWNVTSFSKIVN